MIRRLSDVQIKSRSLPICDESCRTAVTGISATLKFWSDSLFKITSRAVWELQDILRYDSLSVIESGPWSILLKKSVNPHPHGQVMHKWEHL